ncbi:hypothetical protein N658DRAFT_484344 [Parathielavia hyrcaniae]|uniref:Uncharacterized protein n=1 Tax=Parathielavia hyrcaniae TaxID=113614 RepID=A0AAN6T3Z6_9PEZI|nr:hypothetical protein N658DRAFT_484344 [Parathielavia hyrcaniae]
MSRNRATSQPGRSTWLNQRQPPGTEGNANFPDSNSPLLHGFRAAVYGLIDHADQRTAEGSRWFGRGGYFTQTRDVQGEPLHPNMDNQLALVVPEQPASPTVDPLAQVEVSTTNQELALPAPTAGEGRSHFEASRMRQVAEGQLPDAPRAPHDELRALGVSTNYRGDVTLTENLSANIPADRNCSFWIRRLPRGTTVSTLLAAVRGIGRVYCTVITPATAITPPAAVTPLAAVMETQPKPRWDTAAAKIVFFEEAAARRFWDRHGREGHRQVPLIIGEMRAIVERNRIQVAETYHPRDQSRVVCVSGPETLLNVDALLAEFTAKFVFEMDEILVATHVRSDGTSGAQRFLEVEFRFGSFRCQAQTAFQLLYGRPGFTVRYGRDPCDL